MNHKTSAADRAVALDSERLALRAPTLDDFEESAAMWSDASVVRHIGGRPFTREESWARLMRHAGHWQLLGFGFWVVRERTGGRFVGEVGLAEFRRDIRPSFDGAFEIGWALSPSAQGRGYATEAALAALDWIGRRRGPARTVCIIEPENARSIGVATKCGYTEFARTMYKNSSVIVFERPSGVSDARPST
ncbi:MAG TPA: GNAT family N-acetyltransferase [Rhizomicrobium sp.]